MRATGLSSEPFLNPCAHIKSRVTDGIRLDHRTGKTSRFSRGKAWTVEKNESTGIPFFKMQERGESHQKTVPALWLSLVITDIQMCIASLLFKREKRLRLLVGSAVLFPPALAVSI